MKIVTTKILAILIYGVVLFGSPLTYASTFGESCSILPLYDSSEYLSTDTAYGYIKNNIDMKTYVEDGCSNDSSEFKFCIKNLDGYADYCKVVSMNIGDQSSLESLNPNSELGTNPMLKNIILEVQPLENEICLMMHTSRGFFPLMCRNAENTGGDIDDTEEPIICKNISESCYKNPTKSQSLLSFSGLTIQCVKETLDKVFFVGSECPATEEDVVYSVLKPFPEFQSSMKTAVRVALILYVMIYGFKLVLSGEYAHLDRVAMFVIKFILVTYFAVGLGAPSFEHGKETTKNGMTGYALPVLVQLTNDFTEMVFLAGGSQGLCDFDISKYEPGYEYYKIWDSIDCRIGYYLGMQLLYNTGSLLKDLTGTQSGEGSSGTPVNIEDSSGGIEALHEPGAFTFFPVIFGMFMAGQIIIVVLGILFVVFFVSVLLYFITAYLVCLVTLYVMAYISPIFITMALFEKTKSYFDGWLRVVMSCALQPAVIGGFIAVLLTVYDSTIYENCEFQRYDYVVDEINFSTFELREPEAEPEKCQDSLGYKLMKYYLGEGWETKVFVLFEIHYINDHLNIAISLIYVMIYVFIFYFFMKSVSEFAADITGGPNLQGVTIAPDALLHKVKSVGTAAVILAKSAGKLASADVDGAKEGLGKAKDKVFKEDISEERSDDADDELSISGGDDDDDMMGGGAADMIGGGK